MAWQRAASVAEVVPDKGLPVTIGGKDLAIFRVGEQLYALEGVCPHAEALLADGFVDQDKVECPLHQATFEIPTGKCLGPPADRDLITFPVKVEGNDVFVDV
jgi:3-phenylpropionate/trans-cinnamate dioxygenase ferredoxin component